MEEFKKQFKNGAKTYTAEIRVSKKGDPYLVLTEEHVFEGKPHKSSVMVYREAMGEVLGVVQAAAAKMGVAPAK